ncbi:MAG: hypothetical protein ACUBOA_00050 [Candidatus Loosdrechtia sp.]|uniref:hypothetical protein n=1 Tax=Candidatus Loosdrechtia sp. TaxID=3101272 RepID=UPI003A6F6F41|nr:MAG: hypothetical protein QY305_03760 [Candidatus Jettenia sp. AMX2]
MPDIMRINISENGAARRLDEFRISVVGNGLQQIYNNREEFFRDVDSDRNQPNATVREYSMNLIYISHSPGCIYYYDSQGILRKICS